MNQQSRGGGCCPPGSEGITYLKLEPNQSTVGMIGIGEMFEQLYAMKRAPREATDEELVGMAREHNYIPRRAEVEVLYADALRLAYTAYYEQMECDLEGA
jgi:hypothetical protein